MIRYADPSDDAPVGAGPLFDAPPKRTGEELRDAGLDLVLENEAEEWRAAALACVSSVASRLRWLSIHDVRRECERAGIGEPHHHNVWGALLRSAKGVVRHTGATVKNPSPSAHARTVGLWESVALGDGTRPPDLDELSRAIVTASRAWWRDPSAASAAELRSAVEAHDAALSDAGVTVRGH